MTHPTIPIAEGERYIGGIVAADGTTTHIVLLPGDNDDATFEAQLEWAKSIGGDLPSRVEQALLYATAKEEFEPSCYWSNTESASGYAWFQLFYGGYQYTSHKGSELRSRAVRRLIIQ